ncbi:PhzF family phenazine biosynthesis protein (plasmid) [Chitinibacter bivalviorum]|uniref:PhzF family phenazine biosynthesis protein n=1 Tax=Chitinibacter bivalviorum TaxID=2739434 RepID=A0A7H9BJN9_9NEIS|nr:PhzF family phenazine biosynthesis protein [Chitinibacter bivalviorum]QLG88231.1 PhzF family phenazine biosynthesis protein [Chitinibacter bivalviorum]QLG90088.1 PhzF family phenazine biosynthesis protein [Chitinibacter bivalviorum]
MARYPFNLLNVFAEKAQAGDPLVVFDLAQWPDEHTMQMLAYQMNGSETAFVERSSGKTRFFHPQYELPFSGKGLLGAAAVCFTHHISPQIQLHCATGSYQLNQHSDGITLVSSAGRTRPASRGQVEIAHALGIDAREILSPLQFVDTGVEQLLVQVKSRQTVLQAHPHPALLAEYAESPKQNPQAVIWNADNDLITLRSFVADHFGIYEDFGAGSAALNLGSAYLAQGGRLPFNIRIEQGHTIQRLISRLSVIYLQIDTKLDLHLKGKVMLLGAGELTT